MGADAKEKTADCSSAASNGLLFLSQATEGFNMRGSERAWPCRDATARNLPSSPGACLKAATQLAEQEMISDTKPQRKLKGRRPELAEMMRRPHQQLALVFGCGLSPIAPGALGSLAGFGLFFALQSLSIEMRIVAYVALVAIASWAASRTGSDLEAHDHNAIVIDETIGMSLTLEAARLTAPALVVAFLLFRLFDVWKPWPVYLADRSHAGGFMVILDDILAAGWAGAVLFAANWMGIF